MKYDDKNSDHRSLHINCVRVVMTIQMESTGTPTSLNV